MLQRRELVIVRGRARNAEAAGGQGELVRAVCERDVEAAAVAEAAQPAGARRVIAPSRDPGAAVPGPDDVMGNPVHLEQFEGAYSRAVTTTSCPSSSSSRISGRKKRTWGELVMSIQTRIGTTL